MSRLPDLLARHRACNAVLARARKRLLRSPSPFYVRRLFYYVTQSDDCTDCLLYQHIPAYHNEQVYALLADSFICLSPA